MARAKRFNSPIQPGNYTTALLPELGTTERGSIVFDTTSNQMKYRNNSDAWTALANGATTFVTLTDVPGSYSGAGNKIVKVNSGATALEFVTLSGDATINATGVVAIASGVIVNADISASAAIDFSKLAALSSANILVGNGSNVATSVAVTGDVTISNAGVTAIASGVIVNADVSASAAIDESKIAFSVSGHDHDGVNSKLVAVGTAAFLSNNVTAEAGASDYTIAFGTAGGAYILTVPAVGGNRTFAFINQAQTWAANQTIPDANLLVVDDGDPTKVLQFQCSGITAGQTRTVTIPDASGTMTLLGNGSTGSGNVVLATSATLVTPTIGVATATSVNKVAITAPATSATLTIADGKTLTASNSITLAGTDGKTLTVSNNLTFSGTDGVSVALGGNNITLTTSGVTSITLPTSGTIATLAGTETLSGKTLTTPVVNGIKMAYAGKSGDYTATATDGVLAVDTTGGNVTITLPAASGNAGLVLTMKKTVAANSLIIDGNGAETIDGAANVTLTAQYDYRTVVCNGSNWLIIGNN